MKLDHLIKINKEGLAASEVRVFESPGYEINLFKEKKINDGTM